MSYLPTTRIDGYALKTVRPMDRFQIRDLLSMISPASEANESGLGGRCKVQTSAIPGLGSVVVKSYARGGVIGRFVKETYLRTTSLRCMDELEWLQRAGEMGISAPSPVAGIWQGRLFYRCWLAMADIGTHENLADISRKPDADVKALFAAVREQIGKLLDNRIFHVDLHPGNVLVDENRRVVLIDFDKARFYDGSTSRLFIRYALRWERAVAKHGLDPALTEVFSTGW